MRKLLLWQKDGRSYSTDRRVEEDTAWEVCIAPLSKRCLFFEVPLDSRKILLGQDLVITLICRFKVLEILLPYFLILQRFAHRGQILCPQLYRIAPSDGVGWRLINGWKTIHALSRSLWTLHIVGKLASDLLVAWLDYHLLSHIVDILAIDQGADLALVSPVINVLQRFSFDNRVDFSISLAL